MMHPLSADEIRGFAILMVRKGTIASRDWDRMTGAEKHAVLETARRMVQAGTPVAEMRNFMEGIDVLELVQEFAPPSDAPNAPETPEPAPDATPRRLDEGEAGKAAAWIVMSAGMDVPKDISADDQRLILSMVRDKLIDQLRPVDVSPHT